MPGDELPDGTMLKSERCGGRQDKCVYTSPTVRYAGLRFYATPRRVFPQSTLMSQIVLQCRHQPGTFRIQRETMRFSRGKQIVCPHVSNGEVEWVTTRRQTVVVYGILVRTYLLQEPPEEGFVSPVD